MTPPGEGAGPAAATGACDVFISYARGDRPKAAALAKALEHRQLRVFWDPELRAGDPWARKIEEAVESALSVVVLWSAEAVESRWVNAEARAGLDHDKLVPVCLDDAEPPLVFREIQWRSVAAWDGEGEPPGIEELVADIEAAIARSTGGAERKRPGEPSPAQRPWRALAALAAGLALGATAVVLDLWGATLEGATDLVGRSGLPLPPLAMQVAAVGLATLYVVRHRRRVWPLRAASFFRVLTCSLALALGLGVLYDWAQQILSEKRDIHGFIKTSDSGGIRVSAQDSLGIEISPGGEAVDDETGEFNLGFRPVFGDRPRRLRIEREGCYPESVQIGRREWRSKQNLDVAFTCGRRP